MKWERFPHTRKPLLGRETVDDRGGNLQGHREDRSHRGAEDKVDIFTHRRLVPTDIHQPERLLCSPAAEASVAQNRSSPFNQNA